MIDYRTQLVAQRVFIQKRRDELLADVNQYAKLMSKAISLNPGKCSKIIAGCKSGHCGAFLDLDELLYQAAADIAEDEFFDIPQVREAA